MGRVIYALIFLMIKLAFAEEFILHFGMEPQNERRLDELSEGFPAIAIIQLIIMAPILEELLFRYVIYHLLRRFNRELAIMFTSFFFAVLHILAEIQNGMFFEAVYFGLSYMVIAVVLAIIYEKRKNIIFCMILHMLNNILSVVI
jgi:membrane protease YdiL (CAAX protease family)